MLHCLLLQKKEKDSDIKNTLKEKFEARLGGGKRFSIHF